MTFENIRNGMDSSTDRTPVVKTVIIGVGGGGSNAVDNMIAAGVKVDQFMAINTDYQALRVSKAKKRVQIGFNVTHGHGSGADPEKGKAAAEECRESLATLIKDMDLVFITAGMGGGTGTGAAPIIAEIAHNAGKLVVAFVTTPFKFEGAIRMRNARMGIEKLAQYVDSMIVVPNEKLALVAKDMSTSDAFKYADDILRQGVQATTDIIANPGRINVDFADVRTVLEGGGEAIMGIGRASGTNRAVEAVKRAVNNSVLDTSIEGATRAIINIEGGDIKLSEMTQAADLIKDICSDDANLIFGHAITPSLKDEMQVTIIATGFTHRGQAQQVKPQAFSDARQPAGNSRFGAPVKPQPVSRFTPPERPAPNYATGTPVQQSFFGTPPESHGNVNNGYVGMDDESDLAWLANLNNDKRK